MSILFVFKILVVFFSHVILARPFFPSVCSFRDFPYVVTLRIGNRAHFCGGVLLHSRWVLTAAHCTFRISRASYIWVVVSVERKFKSIQCDRKVIHDLYDPKSQEYDFCLLHLREPYPKEIKFAVIPGLGYTDGCFRGRSVTWLDKEAPKGGMKPVCLDGDFFNATFCVNAYRVMVDPATVICVYFDEGQPCSGDSGSPLFCDEVVVGLTSWGVDCDFPKYVPNIFARVDSAVEFIERTLNKDNVTMVNNSHGNFMTYSFISSKVATYTEPSLMLLFVCVLLSSLLCR